MMGAPTSQADELFALSNTLLEFFDGDAEKAGAIEAAIEQMKSFVDELAATKRAKPGDDLMTILLDAADKGIVSMDDACSIALELLAASSDNTARSACHIVAQLASRPGDWLRLRSDPRLIAGAIEECLRFAPVVEIDMHVSQVPTVVQDVEVPADTIAWLSILAANHDPTVYPDPQVFDLSRRHARPQLNFGLGRHFCIGAALARMELEALLSVLTQQWSSLAPAVEPGSKWNRETLAGELAIVVKAASS
jgi:cytochrome P450